MRPVTNRSKGTSAHAWADCAHRRANDRNSPMRGDGMVKGVALDVMGDYVGETVLLTAP
jgi:hypothetical protein